MEATLTVTDMKHNKPMKEKKKRVDSLMELSEEDELLGGGAKEDEKKKSRAVGSMKSCQAEKCAADLSDAKPYHRRHKVCEQHAKAQTVVVAGFRQRFCQQCSRFHEVSEFDEAKRSCRRRLAGHNERRRKNQTDNQAEGTSSSRMKGSSSTSAQLKAIVCRQVEDGGRIQRKVQENANYKHFHVS